MFGVTLLVLVARCQAELYVSGHCNSSVNGVWSPLAPLELLFEKGHMRLLRGPEGWSITAGADVLGTSKSRSEVPGPAWDVVCGNVSTPSNLSFANVSVAYDLSAEHCGARRLFRRIDVSGAAKHFLFVDLDSKLFLSFNCSAKAWDLTELPEAEACQWTHPSEARAVCNGTSSNVTLRQEFYPLQGCGLELFPEGDAPAVYRGSGSALSFCGRWSFDGQCEEPDVEAATGPPLLVGSCRLEPGANLQLPLSVYETLDQEAEPADCDAGDLAEPDLQFLRVMAGGESNFLRQMLLNARGAEDIEAMAKEIDVSFVVSQGWPFAFLFLWLPFSLYFTCSACSCCGCCRCYAKERQTRLQMKLLAFVLLLAQLATIVFCGTLATAGLQTLEDGRQRSLCATERVAHAALEGSEGFYGLRPLLRRFEVLLGGDRQAFLDATSELERRGAAATASLAALAAALDGLEAALQGPLRAARHRCRFCEELRPLLEVKQVELRRYLAATALAGRRALQGDALTLHRSLAEASEKAAALYLVAVDALKFLGASGLKRLWDDAAAATQTALGCAAALGLATFGAAFAGLASFAQEPRLTGLAEAREYAPRTSRLNCCAWCCFSLLAMAMCAVSGTLVVTYAQLGGFCLVLHEDLPQLLSRAGASAAAPCLEGAADGLAVVRGAVEDFATQPLPPVDVEELRRFVREHPVEALILPEDVAADQRYGAMGLDPRSSVGLSTSMACEDHNLGSQVIPGMATFLSSLASLGGSGACGAEELRCAEVVTTAGAACAAAQRWLREAKASLRAAKAFRCGAEVLCDLRSLSEHLRSFDRRLREHFEALALALGDREDAAWASGGGAFASPLPGSCAALAEDWRRLLRGLCFVSLPGLRTTSLAFLAAAGICLSAVLLMYVVWRRAYDNFHRPPDRWRESSKRHRAEPQASEEVSEESFGI